MDNDDDAFDNQGSDVLTSGNGVTPVDTSSHHRRAGKYSLRSSWFVCLAGSLTILAVWGNFFSFGVILVPLLCQYQAGRALTSLIGSIGYGVSVGLAPVGTQVGQRFGAFRTMMIGALLTAGGLVLSSFPDSVYWLFVTYGLIVGVGGVFGYITVIGEIPSYFPPEKRSQAIALSETGSVVGMLVMAPLLEVLVNQFGWRHALWGFASVLFLLLLPAPFAFAAGKKWSEEKEAHADSLDFELQLSPPAFTSEQNTVFEGTLEEAGGQEDMSLLSEEDEGGHEVEIRRGVVAEFLKPYRKLFRNRQNNIFLFTTTLYYFGFSGPAVFVVDLSTQTASNGSMAEKVFSTDLSSPECKPDITDALLYTYMALVSLVLFPTFGWIFDHIRSVHRRIIIVQAFYLFGVFALFFGAKFHSEQWHFVLFSLLIGVSRTPDCLHQVIVLQIVGDDLFPFGWSLLCLISSSSDMLGPPITGWIADQTGSFGVSFLLVAVLYLVAVVCLFLVPVPNDKGLLFQQSRTRKKRRRRNSSLSDSLTTATSQLSPRHLEI